MDTGAPNADDDDDVVVPPTVVAAVRSGKLDVQNLVHRVQDAALLEDPDLLMSLAQMRRGELTEVRPRPEPT